MSFAATTTRASFSRLFLLLVLQLAMVPDLERTLVRANSESIDGDSKGKSSSALQHLLQKQRLIRSNEPPTCTCDDSDVLPCSVVAMTSSTLCRVNLFKPCKEFLDSSKDTSGNRCCCPANGETTRTTRTTTTTPTPTPDSSSTITTTTTTAAPAPDSSSTTTTTTTTTTAAPAPAEQTFILT